MKDLQELKRQGLSISQISSVSGFDRKTVRKYLNDTAAASAVVPQYKPRPPRSNKLEALTPYIEERLSAGVWNAVVLLEELRGRGYTGGYTILKDYLRPLRQQARVVAVRRFETPPGHQAQLDWGELGHIETPEGEGS